ncbi:MAG: beta strand repeat-containing protein [Acetatifactor sp.]
MRKKVTKEKMKNRILSVFLAVTILFSALPVNALAEGDGATQEEGTEYTSVVEEVQAETDEIDAEQGTNTPQTDTTLQDEEESPQGDSGLPDSGTQDETGVDQGGAGLPDTGVQDETGSDQGGAGLPDTGVQDETGSDQGGAGLPDSGAQSGDGSEQNNSGLLGTGVQENVGSDQNSSELSPVAETQGSETTAADSESTGGAGETQESGTGELEVPLAQLVALAEQAGIAASVNVENKKITVDAGGLILLSNFDLNYEGYTIILSTLGGGSADLTSKITVEDTNTTYTFQGLGSDSYHFSGTIQSQDSDIKTYGMTLNVPLFKYVDVSKAKFANLNTFKINYKNEPSANNSSALLAETVCGTPTDSSWANLAVQAEKYSVADGSTTTAYLPGALIGTMTDGASLTLRTVSYPDGASVSSSGNAGLLCNTMNANSSLAVGSLTVGSLTVGAQDNTPPSVTITAGNGDAGGLVGRMEDGSSLTVNTGADTAPVALGSNFTITGNNAGGLIGSGENVKLDNAKVIIDGANVKGSVSAGGLIGNYSTTGVAEDGFASYDGSDASTLKVNNVALGTTSNDGYAGGLFGVLELTRDFSISNASVTSTIAGSKAYYGGLIGQVKGNSADSLRALTISGTSEPRTSTSVNLNSYAGAIAVVGDTSSPVYVKIEGEFSPTFGGVNILTKGTYFGGIAAYLKSDSVLELTANVTIACDRIAEKNGYGGSVLGIAERGSTLCLGGTTDLSGTKFNATYINEYTGQIVGTQDSALIYVKSDWTLIRQSTAQQLDDIGTYGQVIRLGGNMGMGTPSGEQTGLSEGLISQNATTYKTEFNPDVAISPSENTFTITTADQLALLAIEEQTKCAFHIFGTNGTDYYLKSNPTITLGADISLAHTGITGLQRDINVDYAYAGTLDGQNHTLTIAAGEIYGFRGNTSTPALEKDAGSGQIHGHTQVGVFSQANGTMQNLTVNGDMNLYFRTKTADTSATYLAGGLVAKNTAASTYTNVTTSVNIQYQGTSGGSIGGLVGLGTALTLTDCTGSATINAGNSSVYAGGLIGQYTGTAYLTVSNTTLSGTMTATGANHARLGGLVSRIAKGSYDVVNVTLTNITMEGQTIKGEGITGSTVNGVNVPSSCGGLLGYEWNNASVTFGDKDSHNNGLTVTGDSSVTVDGTTETAGLVYTATGYWQVNDIKLENFSISSGNGDLGLLICRGWKRNDNDSNSKPYLIYVEETNNQAYSIMGNKVTIRNQRGYFDEWVAYTCESKETIMRNGNSVISIATKEGTLVENQRAGVNPTSDNCTSYQNRTEYGKTAVANPNARYYYDLDVIRDKSTTNGKLDTPGELVLWAVWRYSEEKTASTNTNYNKKSNIQDFFLITDKTYDIYGTTMDGNNTSIDLTGYAYYPITVDGFPLEVKNITIKFANQEIETAEGKSGENLDSLNRTTVGTTADHTQHYLLHSGLLLNYQNSTASADVTMAVSNVTFQGTIGKGPNDGSGALICGQLGGYTHATSPKYAKLNIQGVTLSDVSVNADKTSEDTDYAPLLVNRVGSYSSLSAQNVSTSGYDGVTSSNNPAATSLIGHVGSDTATNITLAFSNGIALNGKKENSIFSHATLLESFRYQSGGSGYYRFYEGDTFTFGREISESVENKDGQKWYSRRKPEDTLVEVKDGENTDFKDFLPYVCKSYTDGTDKYHELEVNLASPNLTEGCGTYDDPYIISSPGQLMRVADFINGNNPQNGWKVNKVDKPAIIKTEENNNHIEYEVGKTGWDDAAMRTYLRSAYYQITADLSFNSFSGFGSVDNPFVGVIDGRKPTDGSDPSVESKPSVEIKNAGSGFINVSYGSVVRNLIITYTGTKTLTDTRQATADKTKDQVSDNSKEIYADSYFGGIIGTVMGGDSLIDNVTVNMDGFTIETSYDLQCAGGFVGLIQGGGVVFRNMGATERNPGYTDTNSTYYVDKYIGRVLDGYAINEIDSAEGSISTFAAGTGKNYSIPDISSLGTIAWNNGNISIGNAQQMMIFTDIINSGAASGGNALAYTSGKAKTRNADYSKIGNISDSADTAFATSRMDDTALGESNYPYLIAKYAGNDGGFWTACTSTAGVSVTFTKDASIDLSPYGNSYRGIGGRYQCTASQKLSNNTTVGDLTLNTPKISTITGNNVSLRVENNIAEYRADNFYANAVGGLFNVLRHEGATITGVNVYGTVNVCSGLGEETDVELTDYLLRAPVGGVIGRDYSTVEKILTLNTVSFGKENADSTVYGECVTGGLIGSSGSKKHTAFSNASANKTTLSITDCSYQSVKIVGGICTGGFVGSTVWNSDTYATFNESNKPNKTMEITWTDSQIDGGKDATISNLFCASGGTTTNGVGGIIGFCSIPFVISGVESQMTSFDTIELFGGKKNKRGRIGGLIGFIVNDVNSGLSRSIASIKLTNMTVGATTDRYSSSYDDNAGIVVGTWYAKGNMTITDCVVENSSVQANSSGGIMGYGGNGGNIVVRNVRLTDITLPRRGGTNVGAIGGQITNNFYVHNILLQNLSFSNTGTGRFFGTGSNARILGVTIQQTNGKALPQKDIYNKTYPTEYGTTNYVVYAGYNSGDTITAATEITTKPFQRIPGLSDLHGDTVEPNIVFSSVSDANTYYQNLNAAGVTKEKVTSTIRSTYNDNQETKLANESNFPVVLIDGDASVLKQYLNASTNGGFDSIRACGKVNVSIDRYLYDKDSKTFIKTEKSKYPDTLIYHSTTGEFTTTAQYDNQQDTFTLVTVTMTGYSSSDKFVLHIPVIVRRMLQIDFMATMSSGTVFNKTDAFYSETRNHALASKGENITGYLTFHYNSNASDTDNPASYDWQSYMEGGGDLLGYYKKTVDTGTNPLPAGTQITLIDCQNGDMRYYAEVNQETALELFNGGNLTFKASNGDAFTPATLSDLLKITAASATDEQKANDAVVKWVQLDESAGATVKALDEESVAHYYRLYDEANDTNIKDNLLYTLTVGNSSPRENYFVVISIPGTGNHRLTLNKGGMVWSNSTTSPPLEVHQIHRYLNEQGKYTQQLETAIDESSFNFLANYTQSLTDTTTVENVPVLSTNAKAEFPIAVTNTVSFNSQNYTDADPLYQNLVISLKKTEDGVTKNVSIPSDAVAVDAGTGTRENAVKLYAYYTDASSAQHYYVWNGSSWVDKGSARTPATSYSWSGSADSGEMVLPFAAKNGDSYQYIDLAVLRKASGNQFFLEADTTLEMSMASILNNNTVPYDSASGEIITNYTQVDATSILSFTTSGLSYSTLRGSTSGRANIRKYYLNTSRDAILRLDYRNIDQLGINAREEQSAVIDTILTLDLSNMEGFTGDVGNFKTLSEADTVQFTLSLKQKGNTGYSDVSIGSYMTGAAITDGSALTDYTITLHKNDDGTYPYYNAQSGMFTIPLSFTVNMDVKEYANYRICAGVALQKDNVPQDLSVNVSSAFLTYTYAKINVNGYWE